MAINDGTSAVHRVFNITELLERILLEVTRSDHKCDDECDDYCDEEFNQQRSCLATVLLSQQVDKTFNATINGSAKILRALWLLPTQDGQFAPDDNGCNPLLMERSKSSLIDKKTARIARVHHVYYSENLSLCRHPYFKVFNLNELEDSNSSWNRMHFIAAAKFERVIQVDDKNESADGTWRPADRFYIMIWENECLSMAEVVNRIRQQADS